MVSHGTWQEGMKVVKAFMFPTWFAAGTTTWFLLLFWDLVIFLVSLLLFWILADLPLLFCLEDCIAFLVVAWVLIVVWVVLIWLIVTWLSCMS